MNSDISIQKEDNYASLTIDQERLKIHMTPHKSPFIPKGESKKPIQSVSETQSYVEKGNDEESSINVNSKASRLFPMMKDPHIHIAKSPRIESIKPKSPEPMKEKSPKSCKASPVAIGSPRTQNILPVVSSPVISRVASPVVRPTSPVVTGSSTNTINRTTSPAALATVLAASGATRVASPIVPTKTNNTCTACIGGMPWWIILFIVLVLIAIIVSITRNRQ